MLGGLSIGRACGDLDRAEADLLLDFSIEDDTQLRDYQTMPQPESGTQSMLEPQPVDQNAYFRERVTHSYDHKVTERLVPQIPTSGDEIDTLPDSPIVPHSPQLEFNHDR
eukprot:SAG31_NODE_26485_length_441_cov_1.058480_1_plen_110_part_01